MTNILLIGPAWVGDMVMAQSLFMSLKQKFDCSISVLAMDWSRPLLTRMSEVDQIFSMTVGHGKLALGERRKLAQKLKCHQFDWSIVLPNSLKSALIPWWAGIPRRTGWRGEWRYGLLNDIRVLDTERLPLMVQRLVSLGGDVGWIPQHWPVPKLQKDIRSQTEAITRLKLNLDRPVTALCPGAEFGPSKRWPSSHYAHLCERLHQSGDQIWIFGSQNDRSVAAEIIQQVSPTASQNCHDLTGATSLAEAIDLLSLATRVVSNDSGLMHVASALGRPLVAIYGSTSPDFTPPLGKPKQIVQSQIECSPCFERNCPLQHHRCMKELSVDLIWQQVAQLPVVED